MTITIEKVSDGYIYSDSYHPKEVMKTTDELFDRLLMSFEGRCKHFSGDMYGNVLIYRSPTEGELYTGIEAELDARKEDSKVLMKIVDVISRWNSFMVTTRTPSMEIEAMHQIYKIVGEYINAPEITPEQTIRTILKVSKDEDAATEALIDLVERSSKTI